jgi:hypothetical protein
MKKLLLAAAIIAGALFTTTATAQVQRDANGNFYTQKKQATPKQDTPTGYTFTTAKGETFPVYVSENGKYYVVRISKKTGEPYKQYLNAEK